MATDTANPNPQGNGAANGQPDAGTSADNKRGVRKKAELPPELDQLMKELAGDTSSGGANTLTRLERRVGVLEAAFADIVERHESSLRDRGVQLSAVEENVLALRNRIDESHKDHTGVASELRKALGDVRVRLNGLEAHRPEVRTFVAPPAAVEASGIENVAPVSMVESDEAAFQIDAPQEAPSADAPSTDAPAFERRSEGPAYLSSARRAANASVGDTDMTARPAPDAPRRAGRARLLLVGCAAPLLLLAGGAFFVSRHPVTAQPKAAHAAVSAAPSKHAAATPVPPAQKIAPPADAAPVPAAQTIAPPAVAVAAPADPKPSDIASTAAWDALQEKATHGDAAAARDLGLKYLTGDGSAANEDEAARWLLRAAYDGETDAEYWVGTLYARGRGLPEDESQALHWYESAAKQGNAKAMHRLGVAYFEGQGVAKSETDAAHWFTEGAERGNADAAFNLAVLYERGAGVNQSLVDAYKWYAIAARAGDKESAFRVTALSKQLKPSDIAAATHAAADFKPKSSSVADSK